MKNIKIALSLLALLYQVSVHAQQVTIQSLLKEMACRSCLAMYPFPAYASLQASSYNRESTARDAPGWFADSDGTGFIRTEEKDGKTEWVVMEHDGPGTITKMWAPYFYYGGLDDLVGPNINIYLDGSVTPVISENYFKLITGKGSVPAPFARITARAGDCYLPIPFAKSCKITFDKKPFYHIINYRGYAKGIAVKTFTMGQLRAVLPLMNEIRKSLYSVYAEEPGVSINTKGILEAGKEMHLKINKAGAINQLQIWVDPVQIKTHPELLRSVVMIASFDGEQTVWTPLGDFFGSANELNPFQTWTRTVNSLGQMICTWVMPFKSSADFYLKNVGNTNISIENFEIKYRNWKWDERSMHFHANWRSDDVVQGSVFEDWNFIDIRGKGTLVGDAWTVLNPDYGWWGEGDEKIYVDEAWDKKFPTQFGTGTEDYYGWAGGEIPTKDDVFSYPYLANIEVGSTTNKRQGVRGFNICTRVRALDAIPFTKRLVFDMEASPGVDIRNPWDYLAYSSVVFWYAQPGAVSNRPPLPRKAAEPIITLHKIDSMEIDSKKK
ncbi:MAG: glycoside hydrolase family 172 protein [Ginsengibacter sp.]